MECEENPSTVTFAASLIYRIICATCHPVGLCRLSLFHFWLTIRQPVKGSVNINIIEIEEMKKVLNIKCEKSAVNTLSYQAVNMHNVS